MYTVIWPPWVLADYVALWTPAADRQALSDSFDRIDRELKRSPDAKGIPFSRHRRLYYDDPLAVMYAAYPGDDIVIVHAVKRIT